MKNSGIFSVHAWVVCLLLFAVACDPIEPSEESSTAATAENTQKSSGDKSSASGTDNAGTSASNTGGEVSIPELVVPSESSDRDRDMVSRFSFASVCDTLFTPKAGASTIVTTDENGNTVTRELSEEGTGEGGEKKAPVNCLEGPGISNQDAWDQMSGFLTSRITECYANENFWDHRKGGSCIEVEEINLNCNMYEMIDNLSYVKGIRPTLEGYHSMGWRVEQCGRFEDRYWMTLSTVIVAEGKHRYIGKVAEIQNLAEVCKGRSGGACVDVNSQPDAKVLFISSPFQIRENNPPAPAPVPVP